MARLLRTWKIEPVLNGKGETTAQWLKRVMHVRMTLAVAVGDIPSRFVRRQ